MGRKIGKETFRFQIPLRYALAALESKKFNQSINKTILGKVAEWSIASVDGKDIAFTLAGRKATIEAVRKATPIVLEPMVNIEVLAPEASIGDLTGDLSSKRGHVTGTQPRLAATAAISGQIPLAELDDYQGRLKSLTAGKGSYSIDFSHYAQVPAQTQAHLMAAHKAINLDDE